MSCQNNVDFFDSVAELWDEINTYNVEAINHIIDKAGIGPDDVVLHCGTGTGVLIPYIVEKITENGWVDAYDMSTEMLKVAHRKFSSTEKARFILGNIERDRLFGAYDRIMMFCMLPHLDDPVATVARLYEGNLMPGGRIVIAFPSSKEEINSIHHERQHNHVHSHFLVSADELADDLRHAGLNVDYVEDNDSCYIVRVAKPQ